MAVHSRKPPAHHPILVLPTHTMSQIMYRFYLETKVARMCNGMYGSNFHTTNG